MNSRVTTLLAGALGIMITAWACGGSDKSPTSPTPTPTPTPPAGAAANVTVTITANGVSPSSFDLAVGGTVTFMNSDTSTHTPSSDPHPAHTDCPAFASVGTLQPGQARATAALTTARACGFHDHERPSVTALKGTVTIR